MNQSLFYCLICLVFSFSSCQSNPEKKQEKKGAPIVYKITGSLNPEVNAIVYLQDHDNPIQQFHRAKVEQGKFVLEGELVIDAFYDLIIKSDSGAVKPFKYITPLYVEADAVYDIVVQEKGDHFSIEVKTNSLTTNELIAFNKNKEKVQHELEEQLAKYSDETAALNGKLMNYSRGQEAIYNQTIDRLEEISKQSNEIRSRKDDKRFHEEYVLNSKQKASFLIPYSFKYISLNKENYKDYDQILAHLDPAIQKHPLVKAAVAKVDEVKSYYDNMPVFPAITPRNLKGDSLKFEQLADKKMIIVAVWSSKGKNSKMDLPVLVRKEAALKKMGVEVVYLTDDEDYERWRTSNRQIGLGLNSYLLNVTDRDFIENSYNVVGTPRYLWLDPKSRTVIELAGADPTLPDFLKNIKNKL